MHFHENILVLNVFFTELLKTNVTKKFHFAFVYSLNFLFFVGYKLVKILQEIINKLHHKWSNVHITKNTVKYSNVNRE